jgi:hypothetical protein
MRKIEIDGMTIYTFYKRKTWFEKVAPWVFVVSLAIALLHPIIRAHLPY